MTLALDKEWVGEQESKPRRETQTDRGLATSGVKVRRFCVG